MKHTRRSNKKQGKNTRRKRGGKIDYHNLELSYAKSYFYTNTNEKKDRLKFIIDEISKKSILDIISEKTIIHEIYRQTNITTEFKDEIRKRIIANPIINDTNRTNVINDISENFISYFTDLEQNTQKYYYSDYLHYLHSPSYGMLPGDLIVIRYKTSILGKAGIGNVKLHLVTEVHHDSFFYKTLGFKEHQVSNIVNSLVNNTVGMVGRKLNFDTALCTQDQLHNCYGKEFMFTSGLKGDNGDEFQGAHYKDSELNTDKNQYHKIFIVKEDGMKGVIGSSKGVIERNLKGSNYTDNIYSFLVFLKLLNAAYRAIPKKEDLINNPMWQTSVDQLTVDKINSMIEAETDNFEIQTDKVNGDYIAEKSPPNRKFYLNRFYEILNRDKKSQPQIQEFTNPGIHKSTNPGITGQQNTQSPPNGRYV